MRLPRTLRIRALDRMSRRKRRVLGSLAIALGLAVAFVAWGSVEARWLTVKRAVVVSPDVPAEYDGVRIAYVSDLHAGRRLGESHLKRTLERVNALKPDLILLGGDYSGGGGRGGRELWSAYASQLDAPLGVVGVLGNHDVWGGRAEALAVLDAAEITVVENDAVRVLGQGGAGLRIAGLSDARTSQTDIEGTAAQVARDDFTILLTHVPDPLAEGLPRVRGAFDLVLSGHTHGGQITLFGLWGPVPSSYGQRYRTGWRTEEDVPILVSNGTGVVILPFRFFAPPQIHLIELRRGEPARVER